VDQILFHREPNMWLVGLVALQLCLLFSSVWHAYFYLILLLSLLYVLWYRDGKEYSGERRWEGFRNCALWNYLSPARFTASSTTDMNHAQRRLFVVVPCTTPAPLWWMAVHGGRLPTTLNLCYMLPPIFFSIPWLRDVLMWSGGVTYKGTAWRTVWRERLTPEEKEARDKARRNSAILDLLNANRSVCYTPSGFRDVLNEFDDDNLEAGVTTASPDDELFQFAIANDVQIIPVVVTGEKQRYRIVAGSRWLRWVHSKTVPFFGYPVPLLFWTRIFSSRRPPPLEIHIGPVIHCKIYEQVETLSKAFRENVTRLRNIPEAAGHAGESTNNAFHML